MLGELTKGAPKRLGRYISVCIHGNICSRALTSMLLAFQKYFQTQQWKCHYCDVPRLHHLEEIFATNFDSTLK